MKQTTNPATERRFLPIAQAQLRKTGDSKITACGYAAVYNSLSEDLGGFREYIRPGAFDASIADADVRALVDHESAMILGRNKAGTLRLKSDDRGLYFEVDLLPDVSYVRDLMLNMEATNIDSCSFGFRTIQDEWAQKDGVTTRELIKVHCFDVSIVTYPAYLDTSVALRSLQEFRSNHTAPSIDKPRLKKALRRLQFI
jgi:uncharacterized protein